MFISASVFRNWTLRIRAFWQGIRWKLSILNEKILLYLVLGLLAACLWTCLLFSQGRKMFSAVRVNESGESVSSREAREYPGSGLQKEALTACEQFEQTNKVGRFLTELIEPT